MMSSSQGLYYRYMAYLFYNDSVIVNLNLHINLLVRVFLLMIKNNLVLTQGSIDAKEVSLF